MGISNAWEWDWASREPRRGTAEWEPTREGQRAKSARRIQTARAVEGAARVAARGRVHSHPQSIQPHSACLITWVIYESGQLLPA